MVMYSGENNVGDVTSGGINSRATHLKFVCPHGVTLRPQLPDTELLSK